MSNPGLERKDQDRVGFHPRSDRLKELQRKELDVLVVGGGITGAGIALDLALRGLRTGLVEREDWAACTSSASSRLIHGGLRYLEHFEFSLVRESCLERALLLKNAAGYVWPESFAFPVHRGDRVGLWKMMAGLWLYTGLSIPRALGLPHKLSSQQVAERIRGIRSEGLRGGGEYLDAATDDARLTLMVTEAAHHAGAIPVTRVELQNLKNGPHGVEAKLLDRESNQSFEVSAHAAVLAGGPFTDSLRERSGLSSPKNAEDPTPSKDQWITPTRGSHIIVPRERLATDGAVILPSSVDGRIMFVIPWPRHTVIGTTDIDQEPDAQTRATSQEVDYLLASGNGLVPSAKLTRDDVLSTWAGLRPLLASSADPSARSREERIQRDQSVWTIAGGKLTGYRSMAENLCHQLTDALGMGQRGSKSPTRDHPLPGAWPDPQERPEWSIASKPIDPLETAWSQRYAGRAREVALLCAAREGGQQNLDEATLLGEVDWAVEREDARGLVDFFFRRTDLGLNPEAARKALDPVSQRMSSLLHWDAERSFAEHDAILSELKQREAWKHEE